MPVTADEIAKHVGGRVIGAGGSQPILRVCHDSRLVRPGDLYVCLTGAKSDGHAYAGDAVARGASAVMVQSSSNLNKSPAPTAIIVDDTRRSMASAAAMVCGYPSSKMIVIGVTGTNGKTTTTQLLAAIFRGAGMIVGTIGTLGAECDGDPIVSDHTTPESDRLQQILETMAARGAKAVVMEVSSHALVQYRVLGIEFDGAIYTNLTQDHLDYHLNMDQYYAAKRTLFTEYALATSKNFISVINVDDEWGRRLAKEANGAVAQYGKGNFAEVRAADVRLEADRTHFSIVSPSAEFAVDLNIGGEFQVFNALGAIAMALRLQISIEAIQSGLDDLHSVPGRFESVQNDRGIHVIVDYAHSPDGILNVIRAAKKLPHKRILTLFGCGGDRDKTKRPIMGKIAASDSDVVVITSDNPRSEDPSSIISDILPGVENSQAKVIVEPDRRLAIEAVISEARTGDIVILAGKGHEDYQIIGDERFPFDDRVIAKEYLARLGAGVQDD